MLQIRQHQKENKKKMRECNKENKNLTDWRNNVKTTTKTNRKKKKKKKGGYQSFLGIK